MQAWIDEDHEPEPFACKRAEVALHMPPFLSPHGHRNVRELGPLADIRATTIRFAGSAILNDDAGRP